MLYREMGKTGDKVSILGYGCMRFPKKDGRIDEERTEKQVISAIPRHWAAEPDFLFRRYPNAYSASRYDRRFDVANGNLDW